MNLIGHVYKANTPCQSLFGHFREMVGNWPVAAVILHSGSIIISPVTQKY